MRRRPLATALCLLVFTLACRASAVGPVGMVVSPQGDLTLSLDGRAVASGGWHLRPDTYVTPDDPAAIEVGPVVSTTAAQDAPGHATVHERRAAATADYVLDLDGEDLRIAAHVVNTDPAHPLKRIAFSGLTFHFNPAAPVTGEICSWHWTYLQANGLKIFHPSLASPLGCWWAGDDRFAFSAFSASDFDRAALFMADYGGHDGVLPAECRPGLYTDRPLPPGASADVTCAFRITADRSTAHLIAPYKALYDRHFPLPMYTPDARGVAMFAEADQQHVTPGNPLGYHGPECRFDTARGTAMYVRQYPRMERRAGLVGHIFWSPGGFDPPMYPPDFDVLPPSVQANIPTLVKGFHDQGLRVGLCARPGDGVLRPAGADPSVYRLSADDPAQMRACGDRFRHAMAMGFDMFYLDSIGNEGLNDVRILRAVRDAVGPDVLLYSEYCTDMSLPYAGRYCEFLPDGTILWNPEQKHAALRLLCPQATWLCVSRQRDPVPPAFARLGLTPLVLDHNVHRLPLADR